MECVLKILTHFLPRTVACLFANKCQIISERHSVPRLSYFANFRLFPLCPCHSNVPRLHVVEFTRISWALNGLPCLGSFMGISDSFHLLHCVIGACWLGTLFYYCCFCFEFTSNINTWNLKKNAWDSHTSFNEYLISEDLFLTLSISRLILLFL